jgi:hypothetical protein
MGAAPAAAHGTERGFVLLLPTGYYLAGGALAVAASFLVLAAVPATIVEGLTRARLRLGTVPAASPVPTSLVAFLAMCVLLFAGIYGSRDPLANPLPLAVWTVWWVGITLLHAAVGNIWAYINPWTGPYRLLGRVTAGRIGEKPPLCYPDWLGYWPAVALFLGFAWLELVYPAPDDPAKLATFVGLYWAVAFLGMLLFGEAIWRERAEPFSIFFRLVGALSPLQIGAAGGAKGCRLVALALPGTALIVREALPMSGMTFVLLTLASVSFDGLARTFWWLGLGDINPLEFPGRSAMTVRNSVGLLLSFAALAACYTAAARIGWALAGRTGALSPLLGRLVYSLIPISIAFHFAHYLPAFLVDGQYALIAAADPLGTGRNLFGAEHGHVTTSFLNTYSSVRLIWNAQTAAIVLGHVAAIVLAHATAVCHFGDRRAAVVSQIPLAVLMVFYTLFGLWLLSTPVVG